jgi:hypothetical protein
VYLIATFDMREAMAKKKSATLPARTAIAIVTADTHLRSTTWVNRKGVQGDAYFAFKQVCNLARKHGVPVIAAGDLIDKRRNESDVVDFVRATMDTLQSNPVQFYYIQGQHELQYPVPWLSAVSGHPRWLDLIHGSGQRTAFIGDYHMYGLDWRPGDRLDEALAQIPEDCDILVMHQVAQEFMGNIGTPELTFAKIPYAKLLIIGDFHIHQTCVTRGAQGQELMVLSPGSTVLQNIGEDPLKQVYILYSDLSFESVPLASRPFIRVQLDTAAELDLLVATWPSQLERFLGEAEQQGLPDHLRAPLLDVQYRDDIQDAYTRLTSAVGDTAHLFLRELRTSAAAVDVESEQRREAVGRGLTGCLPLLVNAEKQRELFNMLVRLLDSPAPHEAIATLRTEYGLGV